MILNMELSSFFYNFNFVSKEVAVQHIIKLYFVAYLTISLNFVFLSDSVLWRRGYPRTKEHCLQLRGSDLTEDL